MVSWKMITVVAGSEMTNPADRARIPPLYKCYLYYGEYGLIHYAALEVAPGRQTVGSAARLPIKLSSHFCHLWLDHSQGRTRMLTVTTSPTPAGGHRLRGNGMGSVTTPWLPGAKISCVEMNQSRAPPNLARYRPLPTGRISVRTACTLRWMMIPLCLLLSAAHGQRTTFASFLGSLYILAYNEGGGARNHWLIRNALNAFGCVVAKAGATLIACTSCVGSVPFS